MRIRHLGTAIVAVAVLGAAGALAATPADARPTLKKSMWGPLTVNGRSQFPIYRDLGVGIYQMSLRWDAVAPTKPRHMTDPNDPAYRWPSDVDYAISEGRKYGIRVLLMLARAPRWANGGRPSNWAPRHPSHFAAFARAAARRYPAVHRWMIYGEPSRRVNFMPMARQTRGKELTSTQKRGPRLYARILDAAYVSLNRERSKDIVIGGNTFSSDSNGVSPRSFIKAMRLPNGKPPRMDLYGHNPFTTRRPNLRKRQIHPQLADFSDLDTLAGWLDRYLSRAGRNRNRLRIFISEFTAPTDHRNREFNFWVDRKTQARWIKSALNITRSWRRLYTFGWHRLHDDRPNARHDEVRRGLLEHDGDRKPGYYAFRRG